MEAAEAARERHEWSLVCLVKDGRREALDEMDIGGRLLNVLSKKDNVIHLFLACSFVALSVRSLSQQNDIETLEAEKVALLKQNKAMKKAMWDWKQQLFREASEGASSFPIPLSTLKAIYGDTPSPSQPGVAVESGLADSTSKTKFVVWSCLLLMPF